MATVLKSRRRARVADPTPEQIEEGKVALKRLRECCEQLDPVNESASRPRRRAEKVVVEHADIEALWWQTEAARLELLDLHARCTFHRGEKRPELWTEATIAMNRWDALRVRFDAALEQHAAKSQALNFYTINRRPSIPRVPVPQGGPREMSKADICNIEPISPADLCRWKLVEDDATPPAEDVRPLRTKRR